MADLPAPIVRTLIACEEIRPDEEDPKRISLLRITNAIRATAYPAIRDRFAVFAVVSNGRGAGDIWIEIREADADKVIYASARQRVIFPPNPLALSGLSYRVRSLVFPRPGLYWIQLWYDGSVIADLPVVLK